MPLTRCAHLQDQSTLFYACIEDYIYGTNVPARGTSESIFRSLGIHIIATSAYGHLLSLQGLGRRHWLVTSINVLAFILFPWLPVVQFLSRSMIALMRRKRLGMGARHFLAGCLSEHVADGSQQPWPLLCTKSSSVKGSMSSYTIVWCGRMIVLLGLFAQFSGSLTLFVRLFTVKRWVSVVWSIDSLNAGMAVGGLASVCTSIGISVVNTSWEAQQSTAEVSEPESSEGMEGILELHHVPKDDSSRPGPSIEGEFHTQNLPAPVFSATTKLANWLTATFPRSLQADIDLAFLAHLTFYAVIDAALFHLSSLRCKEPDYIIPVKQLYDGPSKHLVRPGLQHTFGLSSLVYTDRGLKATPVMALYLIPVGLATARLLAKLLNKSKRTKVASRLSPIPKLLHRHLLSGTTPLSLLLYLVLLTPLILKIQNIVLNLAMMRRWEHCLARYEGGQEEAWCWREADLSSMGDEMRRLWVRRALWRDGLGERMYVL